MKQEKFKDVAMTYWEAAINNDKDAFANGFEQGVKWQQERMYSEEEVKQAYCEGAAEVSRYYDNGPFIDKNEWFEQFKKK